MRLFIAIQFEDSIINALTDLQAKWKSMGMRGHFTPLQNLHLTLAFIGEYGSTEPIMDTMATASFLPFTLQLDGIGNFGDLYWVGIKKNDELTGYVSRLRRALAENGIPYDKKRFSPHITLVRRAEVNCGMEDILQHSPRGIMEVKSVELMFSTRGKSGMIYTEVGSVGENV